jgi:transposase
MVAQRALGRRCLALEGTGCYGAGLASFLADHGEWVTEIDRPKRTGRTQAKSDPLDAIRAGREALSREHLATPRQRGRREALRVLQLTRAGAVKVAADARRHLKALLVTAPEPLRAGLRGQTWLRQARACAALTAQPNDPVEYRATVRALRATAERALATHQEATQLGKELGVLARAVAPALLAQPGVGPVTGAQVLISWSHPGRLRSEAAFAMLAGAAPIEASSGRMVRHRLNRGGDRQLNRALHTIVMLRERCHEPTRRYVARRTAKGKSEREIRRCLSVRSLASCSVSWSGKPRPGSRRDDKSGERQGHAQQGRRSGSSRYTNWPRRSATQTAPPPTASSPRAGCRVMAAGSRSGSMHSSAPPTVSGSVTKTAPAAAARPTGRPVGTTSRTRPLAASIRATAPAISTIGSVVGPPTQSTPPPTATRSA